MTKPTIVFSDMDGTLLDDRHQVPPATAAGLRALEASGVPFVLVSSRPPGGMLPTARAVGLRSPLIAFGGALVLEPGEEVLRSRGLPAPTAAAVTACLAAETPDICPTAYAGFDWFVPHPADPWVAQESAITGVPPHQSPLPRVLGALGHEGQVHKLLCMGDPGDILRAERRLQREFPALEVCRSKDTYLEVMPAGVDKGEALRFLCARLGLRPADALAFGDNFNDLPLLRAAGIGVAMGNAPAAVRQAAGRVTGSNKQQGLLAVLREYWPL